MFRARHSTKGSASLKKQKFAGDKVEIKPSQKGVAALSMMLLIGGIITEISIAVVLIIYFLGQSGFGAKMSAEALAAANAGVQDSILKVLRSSSGGSYSLNVNNSSVDVEIIKDQPAVGKYQATALGKTFTKRRRLRAILNADTVTGEISIESIQEISL